MLHLQRFYKSDWLDGMELRVLSPLLYMYVATIAPTIAFGGLLQDSTKDSMGMMEVYVATVPSLARVRLRVCVTGVRGGRGLTSPTCVDVARIVAQAFVGMVFAVIGGQALSILRPTGPVVVRAPPCYPRPPP